MIVEHDSVVLKQDIAEHSLQAGDVGSVVHAYSDNKAYEVEFVAGDGSSIAVVTLEAKAVRPVANAEILHVRSVS